MHRLFRPTLLFVAALLISLASHVTRADDPYAAQPGSMDLHFGVWGLGTATTPDVSLDSFAHAVGTDTHGRIVVAGDTCIADYCGPLLMRYDANGRPDTSGNWGADSAVFLSPASFLFTPFTGVTLAPAADDGWWASWQDNDASRFHLLRINADGSFAAGFAPGDVIEAFNANASWATRLFRIDDAGEEKLLTIASYARATEGTQHVSFTRRLASTGARDASFGAAGEFTLDIGPYDFLVDSEVLMDGRIAALIIDGDTWATRLVAVEADGSGLSTGFGTNGALDVSALVDTAFDAEGLTGEYFETAGMQSHPDGRLLLAVGVCCDADRSFRAGVMALDHDGALDTAYGSGRGYVLHPQADGYIGSLAFGVDPRSGNSVHEVSTSSYAFDSMLHFTADGEVDVRYGAGSGAVHDLRWPGGDGFFRWGTLAYDTRGAVLAPTDNFGFSHSILGLEGFGATRFLAPGETRTYDTVPDEIEDFEWPSAPKFEVMSLLLTDFAGRDVAIDVGITNGKIGLRTHGEHDYSFLSSDMVVPVGVVANMLHETASTPDSRSESVVTAGTPPMQFTIASVTAADRNPDAMSFDPVAGVATETFVFSNPDVLSGVDVAIDISVENGCYFLFDSFDELPDDFNEWPNVLTPGNCRMEAGTATNGQVVFLAHVSASTPETLQTTTFRYGTAVSTFSSTAAAADRDPMPFTFSTREGIPLKSFITTGVQLITDINVPVTVSVENGCYFLYDNFEESLEPRNPEDCRTEEGLAVKNQILRLGHFSAGTASTEVTTTLQVGLAVATFTSVTAADDPNDPNDPAGERSGGGPAGPALLLLMMLFAAASRRLGRR